MNADRVQTKLGVSTSDGSVDGRETGHCGQQHRAESGDEVV